MTDVLVPAHSQSNLARLHEAGILQTIWRLARLHEPQPQAIPSTLISDIKPPLTRWRLPVTFLKAVISVRPKLSRSALLNVLPPYRTGKPLYPLQLVRPCKSNVQFSVTQIIAAPLQSIIQLT